MRHTEYDRLSQQQLSLFILFLLVSTGIIYCE